MSMGLHPVSEQSCQPSSRVLKYVFKICLTLIVIITVQNRK